MCYGIMGGAGCAVRADALYKSRRRGLPGLCVLRVSFDRRCREKAACRRSGRGVGVGGGAAFDAGGKGNAGSVVVGVSALRFPGGEERCVVVGTGEECHSVGRRAARRTVLRAEAGRPATGLPWCSGLHWGEGPAPPRFNLKT